MKQNLTKAIKKDNKVGSAKIVLAIFIILAFIIRFHSLGADSFWWDELFTFHISKEFPTSIIEVLKYDSTPPLYYVFMGFWTKLVGYSDAAMRFPSVIFSILSIGTIYRVGKLFNVRTGIYGALIATFSTMHIYWSQQARHYTLFLLLGTLSIYYFLKLEESRINRDKIKYVLSTCLMLYTHVYGIFILVGQLATIFKWKYDSPEKNSLYLNVYTAIVGLYTPYCYFLWNKTLKVAGENSFSRLDWIPNPDLDLILEAVFKITNFKYTSPLYIYLASIPLFPLLKRSKKKNKKTEALYIILGASLLFPLVISIFIKPILIERYLIVSSVILYLLIAIGITEIPKSSMQIFSILIIILSSFVGALNADIYTHENENWELTVNTVEDISPQAVVYSDYFTKFAFEKYGNKGLEMRSVPREYRSGPISNQSIEKVINYSKKRSDIVLILSHTWKNSENLENSLNTNFARKELIYNEKNIRVVRFYQEGRKIVQTEITENKKGEGIFQ